jgi:hypothetical protein
MLFFVSYHTLFVLILPYFALILPFHYYFLFFCQFFTFSYFCLSFSLFISSPFHIFFLQMTSADIPPPPPRVVFSNIGTYQEWTNTVLHLKNICFLGKKCLETDKIDSQTEPTFLNHCRNSKLSWNLPLTSLSTDTILSTFIFLKAAWSSLKLLMYSCSSFVLNFT